MELSTHDEEILITQTYAEFSSFATKGEHSILVAVGRIRNSLIRQAGSVEAEDRSAKLTSRTALFPQYANILRQTEAWQKISAPEKARMEQELLTLP